MGKRLREVLLWLLVESFMVYKDLMMATPKEYLAFHEQLERERGAGELIMISPRE